MNTTIRTAAAVGLSALAVLGVAAGGAVTAAAAPAGPAISVAADGDLEEMLTYMREEERLARDLYAAIADLYDGARPFSMITNSEDHHYDAVGTLLDRYEIEDPSEGLAAGTYAIDEIQDLYDELLEEAETSLADAYQVGIAVEEADIEDLEVALAADFPTDVDAVLSRLLDGSENHLAAFTAAADGTSAGVGRTGGERGPGDERGMTSGRTGSSEARGHTGGERAANAHRADGDCLMTE